MNSKNDSGKSNVEALDANLAKLDDLSKRLVAALACRRDADAGLQGPSHELFVKAAAAYMAEMMANPSKIIEQQIAYWGKSLRHFVDVQQVLAAGEIKAPENIVPDDRRFRNPMWDTHPYFNFIKQQYLLNTEAIENAVAELEGVDKAEKQRIEFFSRQILDMFSPTNFLGTNPEALERAVETDGQSLVDGLENLVRDIESNSGDLLVTLADKTAFSVGKNLATTPGEVVFRNPMFELIQYRPSTEKVHRTPLLIFPPWINKFYILDLIPQKSLIKWVVAQGFTVFVVSWVNPDASYADAGMDTYINDGYLTAINEVKRICGEEQVNAVGYCIGGTTLSLTAALLAKHGDRSLRSATFFATLTDFSDPGEMGVFLDDDFVDGIEREVADKGYLRAYFMARTFSYLRANDLVYAPAIRSYMMGEAPPAFDLLYWNGDSTNLPGRMVVEYLRWLCQQNLLVAGKYPVGEKRLSIRDIHVPVFAIACETDHIAPWQASLAGISRFASRSKTLVLAQSGHIAGIVNPPEKRKYGHYTNADRMRDAEAWKAGATFHEGSWWPRWGAWLARRSGARIAARAPVDSLCPAPGTYVVSRS